MPGDVVLRVLAHVWRVVTSLNVPAAVMGGIAVSAWKHIRATHDVDLLVALDEARSSEILAGLAREGFYHRHVPPVLSIGQTRIIQLLHDLPELNVEIRVDLLLADSDFQRTALARAVTSDLVQLDPPTRVVTCEDLIIFKLMAGRVIDRLDAAYLLRINRERMDLSYLFDWARRIPVEIELGEIWPQAFPGESLPSHI